jgi:hypothetical protein
MKSTKSVDSTRYAAVSGDVRALKNSVKVYCFSFEKIVFEKL